MRHALLFLLPLGVLAFDCWQERDRGYSCEKPESTKFYFDQKHNVCQPLFHRGCGGNGNQFTTAADCKKKCEGAGKKAAAVAKANLDMTLVVNACNLTTDAKISDKVHKCDNGCPMGFNCNTAANFCCPTKHHICSLPAESGNEREIIKHYGRYAYVPGLKNCIRFSYFGLEGNFNNFLTYQQCKEFCSKL